MKNKTGLLRGKTAALYDPYLDVLGGGEKDILSILKVLEDEGCLINIFWDDNLQNDIKLQLDISFRYIIPFLPNIFKRGVSVAKKLATLRRFDYFFYVTDGSYFVSTAKNNFIFCMVPQKQLYDMALLNRLKTANYKFIAISNFTKAWLNKWGINASVIYPYLDEKFINSTITPLPKEKIILSVGRFFKHLHSKKQDLLIQSFKKLKQENPDFKDFKLVLVGGLRKEDEDYFKTLKKLAATDASISLKPNLPFAQLFELYQKSLIYWHFTGFGIDEEKHPDEVEHLGITPLEAMAAGCITFCYAAGGPKELIKEGKTGFLFKNEEELLKKSASIVKNPKVQQRVVQDASLYVRENFNYTVFKKRVKEVILNMK